MSLAVKRLTQAELGYLAGVIDGEGSISLVRSRARASGAYVYPLVRIANTNKALIDWLYAKWPKGAVGYTTKTHLGCKDCFHWALASGDAWELLEAVEPYLVIKRQQAEVALAIKSENDAELARIGRKTFGHGHEVPQWLRHFREACSLFVMDLNRRGIGGLRHRDAVLAHIRAIRAEEGHAA